MIWLDTERAMEKNGEQGEGDIFAGTRGREIIPQSTTNHKPSDMLIM